MLSIQTLTVGDLQTNCYLVSSEVSPGTVAGTPDSSQVEPMNECLIIDPGDDADFITQTILENKLKPIAIVLTHGHFDHVLGCLELKLNFNVPIMLHRNDSKIYSSANQSALHWLKKRTLKVPSIDQYIKEGGEIEIGNEKLKVIETPGHTPGSICLVYHPIHNTKYIIHNSVLFTGDTLFKDGVGRTDFSYSSPSDLQNSLTKIKSLSSQTFPLSKGKSKGVYKSQITIYPGHGETTIL